MRGPKQNGNILFLILLAVVLFAALAYAVTSSMRGGGKDAGAESLKTKIATLIQYGSMVENTVQRLMLVNNCKDTEISFKNSVVGGYNGHVSRPECEVFNPAGGGLVFQDFTKSLPNYSNGPNGLAFNGGNYAQDVGTTCATPSCSDLIMFYFLPNTETGRNTCAAINAELGIPNPGGNPPTDSDIHTGTVFTGTYYDPPAQLYNAVLTGRAQGCLFETSGPLYAYYHVLIAR